MCVSLYIYIDATILEGKKRIMGILTSLFLGFKSLDLCVVIFLADHSFVVVQLGYLSMPTVCITTMHAPTCLDSCRPHFFSDTWPAYVMVSS